MDLIAQLHAAYAAAGGTLALDEFCRPFDGLIQIANIDGKGVLLRWDDSLDALGLTKPTQAQLDAAIQPAPIDLSALKTSLKTQVDAAAEALRLTLITPGSGQALEYQEAYAEAVQVDAAQKTGASATFDAASYPMLSASLGYSLDPTTGKPAVDIAGEARAVLAAYDAYQKAGAAIRRARLKAKAAIDAAADAEAARAAIAVVVWSTPAA